jgi:DNA-binding response OmpR family regulator
MGFVLLLEDDTRFADLVSAVLGGIGLKCEKARTVEEAFNKIMYNSPGRYDLILVDICLQDGDGITFVRKIRAFSDTPVLMISGVSDIDTQYRSFIAGADAFLSKPVKDCRILQIKCESLIRRKNGFCDSLIGCGMLVLDTALRCIRSSNTLMKLTPSEYEILKLLIEKRKIKKEDIINHMYFTEENDAKTGKKTPKPGRKIVDVYFCKIRKILKNYGLDKFIITVPGYGYVLQKCADSDNCKYCSKG